MIALRRLGGERVQITVLAATRGPLQLVVLRSAGGHLVRARQTLIDTHPRELLAGTFPAGGRRTTVAQIPIRRLRSQTGTRTVDLRVLAPGVYVLQLSALTRAGKVRATGSATVIRVTRDRGIVPLLELYAAPAATTNRASWVTQTNATVKGKVDPYGQRTTYYFEYGTTAGYGQSTPTRRARSIRKPTRTSVSLRGLSLQTTYHYRLVSTNCGGCLLGTGYGPDRTFTTRAPTGLSAQQLDADRAIATYNAMQQYFYAADQSGLYAENYPQSGERYSFLWPFSRALDGTITLAGIAPSLLGGTSYGAAVSDRLTGLSRYAAAAGYDSYPVAPYGDGGDKYYDDQAWIGLALAQEYALTGDQSSLLDAENVFNFVYPGGWAGSASFEPGGIYWVNQGVGVGTTNHTRTTNSSTPNAELALLLADFAPAYASSYEADASNIYQWANHYLYNVSANPTDPDAPNPNFDPTQPALMFDHVNATGTVAKTLWTYNQGAMIAANVREYQATGQTSYLSDAEAIATTALNKFTETDYLQDQPAAFNAIFFRGLLVLYAVTSDATLKAQIIQTIQNYANDAWSYYRNANNLFRFPSSSGAGYQLLDQGAMLQIYAMLAWSPDQYEKLP